MYDKSTDNICDRLILFPTLNWLIYAIHGSIYMISSNNSGDLINAGCSNPGYLVTALTPQIKLRKICYDFNGSLLLDEYKNSYVYIHYFNDINNGNNNNNNNNKKSHQSLNNHRHLTLLDALNFCLANQMLAFDASIYTYDRQEHEQQQPATQENQILEQQKEKKKIQEHTQYKGKKIFVEVKQHRATNVTQSHSLLNSRQNLAQKFNFSLHQIERFIETHKNKRATNAQTQ
ncbi:protein kinase 4-like [Panonychus citri]|uniref:protein kinase 4-like n=1 Tax=Panonychus citri TaxID=50023 RepID=UPI00230746E0|nr:protein kinase 4-like [Panonychus citri]